MIIINVGKDMEKLQPLYTIGENVRCCSHWWKQDGSSSKKLKYNYIWLGNFTSRNISLKLKAWSWRDICAPIFRATLSTIAKSGKQSKYSSTDEWINMWYLQTMVYYSALKRKEILTHVPTGMKLEDIILSEISQSQEGKYCIIPLIGDA